MNTMWITIIYGILLFVVSLIDSFILKVLKITNICKRNLLAMVLAAAIGVHFVNSLLWFCFDGLSIDFFNISIKTFGFLCLFLTFIKIITYLLGDYLPNIWVLNRSFSYRTFVHEMVYPFITDVFFPYERGIYCIVHPQGELYSCIRRFYRDCSLQELVRIEEDLKKHFEIDCQMDVESIRLHIQTDEAKGHFRYQVFVDMCFDTMRSFDDPHIFRYFSRKIRKITDLCVDDEPIITIRNIS